MPNRRQFVRQTTAVLIAVGLIVSLLPGLAAAQDQSTPRPGLYEIPTFQAEPEFAARAQLWVERMAADRFPGPGRRSWRGPSIIDAKLHLNPNDAEALQHASEYMGTPDDPIQIDQFARPGMARIICKYWDNFTPAQRENMRQMAKTSYRHGLGHGTENHALKQNIATYIYAELWPDDVGFCGNAQQGKTSAEVRQIVKARLLQAVNSLLDKNHYEFSSQNYYATHLYPLHVLFDCVHDPELKYAAYVALCYHYTVLAANSFRGRHVGPFPRGQLQPKNAQGRHTGVAAFTWLWLGPNFSYYDPTASYEGYAVAEPHFVAGTSTFVMPPAILSLWRGETAPYELTTSAASFGFWFTGEPGSVNRYIYRHPDYAIGSGFTEFYPDEFHMQDHSAVNILYRSTKDWAFIDTQHHYWRSNAREWGFGNNSPFCQMAQHKSAAIAIFNIPEADPWARRGRPDWLTVRDQHYDNLIKEVFVRYPKEIDEVIEENGWVFLREGSVYIAIRPLRPYTIETNPVGTAVRGEVTANFNAIRTTSAQTGFVYDVATSGEFASFAAFRASAIQNPPTVDWDTLSVTYTSLAGDAITATWNPPNYSGPPVTNWEMGSDEFDQSTPSRVRWRRTANWRTRDWRTSDISREDWTWDPENKQWTGPPGDKWYPGSRVLVRPHITVNGAVLPPPREYTPDRPPGQDPADFEYYLPMKSPSANIADGVLSVQTPGGRLTVYAPRKKKSERGAWYRTPSVELVGKHRSRNN